MRPPPDRRPVSVLPGNEPPSSAARSRIACSPTPGAQRPLGGPLSVIDTSSRSAHSKLDQCARRPGVAYDIGEGFGGDPVRRHLYGGRQRRHLVRYVEPDLDRRPIGPP